jgi:hypothetical protein
MSLEQSTPGVDRILTLNPGANELRIRRPSRADQAEIWRRYSEKLARAGMGLPGMEAAPEFLARFDGGSLLAEARFEVLLVPRRSPKGDVIDLTEGAPEHWFTPITDATGKILDHVVSFVGVGVEEFEARAGELAEALQKKTPTRTPPSTDSPAGQTNG